jgi:hypothetical protein
MTSHNAAGRCSDLIQSSTLFRELMKDAGSVEGSAAGDTSGATDSSGSGSDSGSGNNGGSSSGGGAAAPPMKAGATTSPMPASVSIAGGLNADPKDLLPVPAAAAAHGLIQKEKREKGAVGFGLIAGYARASGGISVIGTVLFSL